MTIHQIINMRAEMMKVNKGVTKVQINQCIYGLGIYKVKPIKFN